MLGRGVKIETVVRERNIFLDLRFREESALGGRSATLADQLGYLEAVVGEPGAQALATQLDAFWSAWGDLANDPSGGATRTLVQLSARQVVQTFNSLDRRINEAVSVAQDQVDDAISTVNTLASEIAQLNLEIGEAEINGRTANDLRDRRDSAIDRISVFLPVRVLASTNGSETILIDDVLLVDRGTAMTLTTRTDERGNLALGSAAGLNAFRPDAGRISGLLSVVNDEAPDLRVELDAIAAALTTEVNNIHRTGVTTNGASGINFFDPNGLAANTIKLSAEIEFSTDSIAAGTTGAVGDGSVALAMEALRLVGVNSLGGLSIHERYTETVTGLGAAVRDAVAMGRAQETLVANVEAQRMAEHGVSVDEEMVGLITHQQAYAAAARMVSVADEMVRELLGMI